MLHSDRRVGGHLEDKLRGIQEEIQSLTAANNSRLAFTAREISDLRSAFERCTADGILDKAHDDIKLLAKAVKMDIDEMEAMSKTNPLMQTGDDDHVRTFGYLGIPPQRRLQTFCVTLNLLFTAVPVFVVLFIAMFFCKWTMPFALAYLIWIFSIGKPKHPCKQWDWYTNLSMFKHFADYFPIRLRVSQGVRKQFDPKRNYMFCYHPHGVHSFGCAINFGTNATKIKQVLPGLKIHVQTLGAQFIVPVWREFLIWMGMGNASATTLRKTLSSGPGQSVVLVVGGAEEALLAEPGTCDLKLKNRKGFVKIALQTGAWLVPVFSFGENDVYYNWGVHYPKMRKALLWCQKKLTFSIPPVIGRGIFNYHFGVLPHRKPIVTVIGPPIEVPKLEKPSQEDINKYHQIYVEALQDLHDANKDIYAAIRMRDMRFVELGESSGSPRGSPRAADAKRKLPTE